MGEFTVRADSVDVEQIMRQIRARIREKRGADYTEAELQQLANVKLEKFLDPRGVRSDLVEQFRKTRVPNPPLPNFAFEEDTLYETHRGPLRWLRKLFNPLLKLFFNPNRITDALHIQAKVNTEVQKQLWQREALDPLLYEVIHNLVLELTRTSIEVHNLKMRVESISSRMDFDERRGRSLESVVQYRQPSAPRPDRDRDRDRQNQQRPPQTSNRPDSGRSDQRGEPRHDQPRSDQPRSDQSRADQPRPDQPRVDQPSAEGQPVMAAGAGTSGDPNAARPEGGGVRPEGGNNMGGQGGPRPDGERRRRRRRRRRRPGQTMADGQGPHFGQGGGAPAQAEMGGGELHVHGDAGDDHGADDGDDRDDGDAGDRGPDQEPDSGDQ